MAKGITTYELASLMNVTPQQISRWRNSNDLKLTTAIQISKILGISLDELVGVPFKTPK